MKLVIVAVPEALEMGKGFPESIRVNPSLGGAGMLNASFRIEPLRQFIQGKGAYCYCPPTARALCTASVLAGPLKLEVVANKTNDLSAHCHTDCGELIHELGHEEDDWVQWQMQITAFLQHWGQLHEENDVAVAIADRQVMLSLVAMHLRTYRNTWIEQIASNQRLVDAPYLVFETDIDGQLKHHVTIAPASTNQSG